MMRVFAIAAVVFLAGCAHSPGDYLDDGSVVTLNRAVTVPRNQVAASIRGGFIGSQFDYEGQCRLELYTISREKRVIEPDEFTVEKTNWAREYFGLFHPLNSYAQIRVGEGPNLYWYITYIYLRSSEQPDVYRLRCRHLQQNEYDPKYLTIEQLQTIVGDVMTLGRDTLTTQGSQQ